MKLITPSGEDECKAKYGSRWSGPPGGPCFYKIRYRFGRGVRTKFNNSTKDGVAPFQENSFLKHGFEISGLPPFKETIVFSFYFKVFAKGSPGPLPGK